MPFSLKSASILAVPALAALLSACGGQNRQASSPHGETTITSAYIKGHHVEKIMVTDQGTVAIVDREGCLAQVKEHETVIGPVAEIQTRCPKPERMASWFDQSDKMTDSLAYAPLAAKEGDESDAIDDKLDTKSASAKVLVSNGKALRVTKPADVERLTTSVRALSDELARGEEVTPGPATERGWQMLHVSGIAHVMFAGQPARGRFEAKVSTNGQYKCEFTTNIDGDAPLKATKSGWLKPASAAHAIDVVLAPAKAGAGDSTGTFAAGIKAGTEQKTSGPATAAVFELFGEVQDALGDACLPELEAPGSGTPMTNTSTSL